MFDAKVHAHRLRAADFETLRFFGVKALLSVADASPSRDADEIITHCREVVASLKPAREAGLEAWAAVGVHPLALPSRGLEKVLHTLPSLMTAGNIRAIGVSGFSFGDEREQEAVRQHAELAHDLRLPLLVTAGPLRRPTLIRGLIRLLKTLPIAPERVMVDCCTERTVRAVLECGHFAGLSLHPDAVTVERAVAIVRTLGSERLILSSAAGDAASDLVALARAQTYLERAQLSAAIRRRVTQQNAASFLGVRVE